MSAFAPDVVSFDFGPPLQGPIDHEVRDLIVHEHVSVPADVKTGKAVLDLTP